MSDTIIKKMLDRIPSEPGIMDSSNYSRSAVLASFFFKEDQPHLIFQKRSSSIRQGGEICFPGGRFDERYDRNMLETAVRETQEEMGLNRDDIVVLGQTDTIVASMGAVITSYLGELKIKNLTELKTNLNEVEKVFSVPLKWFIDNPPSQYDVQIEIKPKYTNEKGEEVVLFPVEELGLPDRYSRSWGMRKHRIYLYNVNGETIWGITGQIVRHLAQMMDDIF